MDKLKNVEKLSGYLILLGIIAIIVLICWYFKNVLLYVVLAFVVSLLSQPLMRLMRKLRIKGKSAPDWLMAILSIIIVLAVIILAVTQIIPVISSIIKEAAVLNDIKHLDGNISQTVNGWIVGLFPSLGEDFDAISVILNYLKGATSDISVTGLLGSVASIAIDLAIGIFSVVFISFFFVKDDKLFSKIVGALVPDKIEASVTEAIGESSICFHVILSEYSWRCWL